MLGNRSLLLAVAGIGPTFGEKYPDPGILPSGSVTAIAFSPAGDAVVIRHDGSPFLSAYRWSSSGFGAKYANPSPLPTQAPFAIDFTPSGSHLMVTGGNSVMAYSWSSLTGFNARQAGVALGLNTVRGLRVSPSGSHIAAVGLSTSPANNGVLSPLAVIPWTGTAFGTPVIHPPATVAGLDGRGVAFSPDGNFIAVSGSNFNFSVYPFSGSTLGSPTTMEGRGTGIAFNPTGSVLAWGLQSAGMSISNWSSSGFGSAITVPATRGSSPAASVLSFSPSGNLLAAGNQGTLVESFNRLMVYRWLGTSLGDLFAEPANQIAGPLSAGRVIDFSPSGDVLMVGHVESPFVTAYKVTATP